MNNTNAKSTNNELCHNRAALQNSVHELVSFNQELIRQGTGNMHPPITLSILISPSDRAQTKLHSSTNTCIVGLCK